MKQIYISYKAYIWAMAILAVIMLAACSTTKHLPEGETLYLGLKKVNIVNEDKSPAAENALEEVNGAISIAPNNAIFVNPNVRFPIPFGLWIYNRFERYENGFGHWIFKKLAAKPVLVSTVNPDTRVKVATNLLHDYGYFNGKVTYQVDSTRNPRAVKLSYDINMGKPYFIDTLEYRGFSAYADSLINANLSGRLVNKGDHFNVVTLNSERDRIIDLLRNHGYYYARSEFLAFYADTLKRSGYVNIRMQPKNNLPPEALRTYFLGNTNVRLTGYNGEEPTDSIRLRDFTIYYSGDKPGLRFNVLRNRFIYRKGEQYSLLRQNYTQEALSRLGVFKYNEFQYVPRGKDTLDINVNSLFDLPYDSELELNATMKSTKQTGPGAIFKLSRKNFLRMGASLSLELNGSYEWQTSSTVNREKSVMNSYELGAALTLDFPRIILPWIKNRIDPFRFPSHTNFKIYIDQVNRARYFRMLSFGGSVSYSFQPSRSMKHTVTPLHLAFNRLQHRTAAFDSVATANPMLFRSLDDQFIPSVTYTFTFDDSWKQKRVQWWWENSISSAGNVTSLIYQAFGKKLSQRDKKFLGTPFAQYLKYTTELRPLIKFDDRNHLAMRFMAGVIWAYGNKTVAPYSEQFYVGGANSIRAFSIRSIGPGRFHPAETSRFSYVDETGDIKLEANLEYRFRIIGNLFGGNLNGATFLDAGNVWLMRSDSSRPGAKFTFNKFFDSLALGTGVGIRYDLSFLVLRLDWGIALHVPYETGKSGYYNIPRLKDGMGVHFAIGYPF
mgnify:FL=1